MNYLTFNDSLEIYQRIMAQTGGVKGGRDLGALKSALAQPQMRFGDAELYPTIIEKAAALGFSLIQNHPFVDGNKRIGHALMERFLILNDYEIEATVDEQEKIILQVAAGELKRDDLTAWLGTVIVQRPNPA